MNTERLIVLQSLLLFCSSVLAGALNAVAGGGSFISFPALMFAGVPPITANATNNAALLMGTFGSVSAYRKELRTRRHEVFVLSGISLIGGILGSLLLLHTPQKLFAELIPYLLFVASLLFAFSKTLIKWLRSHSDEVSRTSYFSRGVILLVQLVIATYGGFFGGGIGILLLATLSLLSENIYRQLAYKTLMATVINSAALVPFIFADVIAWPQAILMALGALGGGYLSAKFAYKVNPVLVRRFVLLVGFAMSAYFFVRQTELMPPTFFRL